MANGTIAFDTLSTSGQIDGTARSIDTDYLLMGSSKSWALNAVDASSDDSFNASSGTDNGTGDYSKALSNNMINANYSSPSTCCEDSSTFAINKARATSSVRTMNITHANAAVDKKNTYSIFGELA